MKISPAQAHRDYMAMQDLIHLKLRHDHLVQAHQRVDQAIKDNERERVARNKELNNVRGQNIDRYV